MTMILRKGHVYGVEPKPVAFKPLKLHEQRRPIPVHNGKPAVIQRLSDKDALEMLADLKLALGAGDQDRSVRLLDEIFEAMKRRVG